MATSLNNIQFKAKAQLGLGRVLIEKGHLDDAETWLTRALHNYRQTQDYVGEIDTLDALGNVLSLQGDSLKAVEYLEQGMSIAKDHQDVHSEIRLRFSLGYVGTTAQDWLTAIFHYRDVIDMAESIGNHFFEVRGLTSLGEAWLELGEIQKAIVLLEKALALQEISDDQLSKAFTHFYLAKAYNFIGAPNDSLAHLSHVYPFYQIPRMISEATEADWIMANNLLLLGETDLACARLQEALSRLPKKTTKLHHSIEQLLASIVIEGKYKINQK